LMYKVLLVDDEWIIRTGISKIIDWERHGFCFIGAAENAVAAYDQFKTYFYTMLGVLVLKTYQFRF